MKKFKIGKNAYPKEFEWGKSTKIKGRGKEKLIESFCR